MGIMTDYKWRIKRLFKRGTENGSSFFKDFGFDIWEVITIPYHFIKHTFSFIKRVFDYTPILWNDVDWDHSFILEMFKYKIKRTADYIEKHKRHTHYKRDVRHMRMVVNLIDRVRDDRYYHDKCFKPITEKYGKHIWYIEDKVLNDIEGQNFIRTTTRYEKETDQNKAEIHRAVKEAYQKERKLMKRDWDRLWRIVNKHLREWWD